MKKHHLLLFGVFLLSSSCKTVTEHLSPDPEEVFPDSTGKFLQADKNSTPQTERIEGDWWKIFKDPQLDQLINRLNTYNPDAKAALARYEQSLAVLGITRSKILPTIRGNGSIKTRQDSVNSLLFPISSPNYDQYSIGLNATWEIDLWGRVQASSKNDRFLAESEEANYEALLLSLQATLAQQYFAHHANHSQQTLLQQSRNLASENLQLHQARLDIGEGRQSDVSKALQELQETEAALELAKRNTGKLHHSMAVLLGQLPLTLARPKIFHRLYLRFLLAYPPNYLPDVQTSSQQNSNFAPQPLESDSPKWNSSQNSPSWVMQAMVASPKIISLKEQASSMTMVHNSTSRFLATDYVKVYSAKPKPDIVRAPPSINQPSSTQYAKSTTPCWILKAILESSNSSFKRWSPPPCLLKRQKTDTTRGSLITLITSLPSKSAYKLLHARPH